MLLAGLRRPVGSSRTTHTATNQFSSAASGQGDLVLARLVLGVPPFLPSSSFLLVRHSKRIE